MVKHSRKYYVTNRLSVPAREVRKLCTRRHEIEEVIKTLKDLLGLEACQAGYKRSRVQERAACEGMQEHHLALCVVAYSILERERIDQGITLRQLRQKLIVRGLKVPLPSLKRVRIAA